MPLDCNSSYIRRRDLIQHDEFAPPSPGLTGIRQDHEADIYIQENYTHCKAFETLAEGV